MVRKRNSLLSFSILLFLQIHQSNGRQDDKTPPVVLEAVVRKVGTVGDDMRLECPVEARPATYYEWIREDENAIIDHTWDRYKAHKRFLRIRNLNKHDTGVFICKAVNGFGSAMARVEVLVISEEDFHRHPIEQQQQQGHNSHNGPTMDGNSIEPGSAGVAPVFSKKTLDQHGFYKKSYGDPFSLDCEALGIPPPNITWLHNLRPIGPSPEPSVPAAVGDNLPVRQQPSIRHWPLGNGKSLNVSSIGAKNSGVYTCLAENSVGRVTKQFSLIVLMPTDTPTVSRVSNVTIDAADSREGGNRFWSLECEVKSLGRHQPPDIIWLQQRQGWREDAAAAAAANSGNAANTNSWRDHVSGHAWQAVEQEAMRRIDCDPIGLEELDLMPADGLRATEYIGRDRYIATLTIDKVPHQSRLYVCIAGGQDGCISYQTGHVVVTHSPPQILSPSPNILYLVAGLAGVAFLLLLGLVFLIVSRSRSACCCNCCWSEKASECESRVATTLNTNISSSNNNHLSLAQQQPLGYPAGMSHLQLFPGSQLHLMTAGDNSLKSGKQQVLLPAARSSFQAKLPSATVIHNIYDLPFHGMVIGKEEAQGISAKAEEEDGLYCQVVLNPLDDDSKDGGMISSNSSSDSHTAWIPSDEPDAGAVHHAHLPMTGGGVMVMAGQHQPLFMGNKTPADNYTMTAFLNSIGDTDTSEPLQSSSRSSRDSSSRNLLTGGLSNHYLHQQHDSSAWLLSSSLSSMSYQSSASPKASKTDGLQWFSPQAPHKNLCGPTNQMSPTFHSGSSLVDTRIKSAITNQMSPTFSSGSSLVNSRKKNALMKNIGRSKTGKCAVPQFI